MTPWGARRRDRVHRPARLARPRTIVVASGQRPVVRRAPCVRRDSRPAAERLRQRSLRRRRRAIRRRTAGRRPPGQLSGDRPVALGGWAASSQDLAARALTPRGKMVPTERTWTWAAVYTWSRRLSRRCRTTSNPSVPTAPPSVVNGCTCGGAWCASTSAAVIPPRESTPARHARAAGHPVVTSAEPGEHWRWCYVDEVGT